MIAAVFDTDTSQSAKDLPLGCPGVWRSARLNYFEGNLFEGAWLDGEAGYELV